MFTFVRNHVQSKTMSLSDYWGAFFSVNSALDVYSGTFGILQYNDTQGTPQDITLYNEGGENWLPVPAYFWKVVYNPLAHEAVAFVGLNDAHADAEPLPLCTVRRTRQHPSNLCQF